MTPKPIEFFEEELGWIKNPTFKDFLEYALKALPPYFMEVASSSTGKYHSSWSNQKPMGLAYHTKAVTFVAKELSDAFMLTDDEKDLMVIAAVLHDGVKYGFGGGQHTSKTHEAEGAVFFKRLHDAFSLNLPKEQFDSVYKALAAHQGRWAVAAEPKRFPDDFDKFGILLHVADMVASRKGIRFDCIESPSFVG